MEYFNCACNWTCSIKIYHLVQHFVHVKMFNWNELKLNLDIALCSKHIMLFCPIPDPLAKPKANKVELTLFRKAYILGVVSEMLTIGIGSILLTWESSELYYP